VAPALMVTHEEDSVAVHAQPVAAVTVTVPLLADEPTLAESGASVGAQGAPACVTVKVWPPIVSVPLRGVVVEFAVTLKVTEPLPVPVAPALMVIQPALLAAVQPQPADAVTATVPLPALAVMFADAGEIVGTHGIPAWFTVNVEPAIVTVPVLPVVALLAATVKVADPGPELEAPVLTVIHEALLTAVHRQPAATLTVVLAEPPPAAIDCDVGEILGAQGRLNPKVLERPLALLPPGPTAEMTTS
jgi:hypothetical protein